MTIQANMFRGDLSHLAVPFPFYAMDGKTQLGEVVRMSFDGVYTVAHIAISAVRSDTDQTDLLEMKS